MKNSNNYFNFVIILTISLLFASCSGKDGVDGINGIKGDPGADGNLTCLKCHNAGHMDSIQNYYEMSTHNLSNMMYTGQTIYEYAGGRKSCAKCHSHEGFVETTFTMQDTVAEDFIAPSRIGCGTCHSDHVSFDFENDGQDYALRWTEPTTLLTDETVTMDMGGTSNLCIHCHQPRRTPPTDDGTGLYAITSSHYGPHHGPQSTFLHGIQGAEITGSESYPAAASTAHRNSATCTGCHMGTPTSNTGSHSFKPSIENCITCHSDATDFDINGKQTEIENLAMELKGLLQGKGILDADGHLVTGEYPIAVSQAFWNYSLIWDEDRSKGVHNYPYAYALLKNSIAAMQ